MRRRVDEPAAEGARYSGRVCQPLAGNLKYYFCLISVMDGVSEQVTASGWEGMGWDEMVCGKSHRCNKCLQVSGLEGELMAHDMMHGASGFLGLTLY